MIKIGPYIKITRPKNAVMTAAAAALGFWLARSDGSMRSLFLIAASSACAVGFGNTLNDVRDAEADRTNHPDRPIPMGEMSSNAALVWAIVLAACALTASGLASAYHFAGCLIPLAMLGAYALWLKGVPLLGNTLVSLLVAYALLYGGLGAAHFRHLLIPAFLAFLLNLSREIVKDIQDRPGDTMQGLATTADLSPSLLRGLLLWLGVVYALNMFVPFVLGHFGMVYLGVCAAALLPVHIAWFALLVAKGERALSRVSSLIKWEMLGGLAAMAADRLFYGIAA
jgi:geranylgeranylglycerol-phosphate geranylgeranyltransferase